LCYDSAPVAEPDERASQERRRERMQLPPCPDCGCPLVRVLARTEYVLYVRCPACLTMWSVPKPGVAPFGA